MEYLFLFLLYALYNFLAGIFISIYYYRQDPDSFQGMELAFMVFFPAAGLGYWAYNKEMREKGETEFSRDWYIWKRMININWGLIAIIGILGFMSLSGCRSQVGEGMKWANHQGDATSFGLGLLFDAGSAIAFGFGLLLLALSMAFFWALLIFMPSHIARTIETSTYKSKYLEEKRKNETS
jgi:hypothetical protein